MKFNIVKLFVVCCTLLMGNILFAVEEPNGLSGICYSASAAIEPAIGSNWVVALDRESTDSPPPKPHLIVELDASQIYEYEVYTIQQGATPEPVDLKEDDLWIVWDEDAGHGATIDFSYTGSYVVADPNTNCDYARVSTTNDDIINWVLYKATADGTLTINDTGLNEHDVFLLGHNLLEFWKEDDIPDSNCVNVDDTITYTICWDSTGSGFTLDGAYIIDYLPDGVDYPAGSDSYVFDGNSIQFAAGDSGYDPETHTYIWPLIDIDPNTSDCVELEVVVKNKAVPGFYLHNIAELRDANDTLIARDTEDTLVCCYDTDGILYVDQSATDGDNTGTSWDDAYLDLADALIRARDTICEDPYLIYVAQGTYDPNNAAEQTFRIPDDISVFGGFKSGGCEFSQRSPKKYITVLTGLIDDDGFPDADTVVTMGQDSLLDGFTVTRSAFGGHGVYGSEVDFAIENCRVVDHDSYGIFATNGSVEIRWCLVQKCGYDGIYHDGDNFELVIENSQIRKNMRYGVSSGGSVSQIKNSVISENGLNGSGQQGLRFIEPAYPPILYNNTIAHNKSEGIYFEDDGDIDGDPNQLDYPEVQNCILYYNNMAAETPVQFTGINRSYVYHSCIYDPNDPNGLNAMPDVNYNFSANPKLAYYDPNNVHLAYDSPCKDAGNPYFSADEVGWYDMDSEERLIGTAVDIGADELYSCSGDYTEDDFANAFDRNADGVVNYHEFAAFSQAWLSRDPNDPAISDSNLFDPNDFIGWNPQCDLNGDYQVTLPDVVMFMDDAPWLWEACWRDNYLAVYGIASGGDNVAEASSFETFMVSESLYAESELALIEPEASLETLVQMVGFLDEIAAENSDNLENIQELRATLMDEITAIWNRQNE